jgi:NADPH:quinone reductase-like Zn-dependent oxidoreductase
MHPPPLLTRLLSTSAAPLKQGRKLSGKHALITGGSRGIGLAIAQSFVKEGARCTLVGRNENTLSEALAKLVDYEGGDGDGSRVHGMMVGDVGKAEFWEGVRLKFVSFMFVFFRVRAEGLAMWSEIR